MKTVKEWLNEINIQKLIGYCRTMYPTYLDDTRLDETMTIRQCRDMERSNLQDAIHNLQNTPATLPDDGIQYIIFGHKILIDSTDDEVYVIVSVNQLLDYCIGADTMGYDQYDCSEILGFLVADIIFVELCRKLPQFIDWFSILIQNCKYTHHCLRYTSRTPLFQSLITSDINFEFNFFLNRYLFLSSVSQKFLNCLYSAVSIFSPS